MTHENQQLKLQIAEKRLLQSENLNLKLMEENEQLKKQLIGNPTFRSHCDRCEHVEAQLRETQQTLERSMQHSNRKKESVLNKMGELAEKYHAEKDKNRMLSSELRRMNDTLARFEHRITALLREKRTLAGDIEGLRERLALSSKLSVEQRRSEGTRSIERRESENRNYQLPPSGMHEETKARRDNSRSLGRPETQIEQASRDQIVSALARKHTQSESANHEPLSRQPPFKIPAESEDHSRDYYNSHILRSLERYAQRTVEENKAQRDNLSSKTHIVPPSRLSYEDRREKRTSEKLMGKENLQRQESMQSLVPSVKSAVLDEKPFRQPFQEVLNSKSGSHKPGSSENSGAARSQPETTDKREELKRKMAEFSKHLRESSGERRYTE